MSRKGCSPNNAACEGFFGRLKTELFYPRDWRTTTIEQFIQVVDGYIRWYNEKRIKLSLGLCSPVEYPNQDGAAHFCCVPLLWELLRQHSEVSVVFSTS